MTHVPEVSQVRRSPPAEVPDSLILFPQGGKPLFAMIWKMLPGSIMEPLMTP